MSPYKRIAASNSGHNVDKLTTRLSVPTGCRNVDIFVKFDWQSNVARVMSAPIIYLQSVNNFYYLILFVPCEASGCSL